MARKQKVGTASGAVRHVAGAEATRARRIGRSVGAVEIDVAGGRLLLKLMLVLLGASRDMRILLGKDTDDVGRDFTVDNGLVVFADYVNTKFLEDVK